MLVRSAHEEEDIMKGRRIALAAVVTALLSFSSGCLVADRPPAYGRRQVETYYYYPDAEVYYYPGARRYYWIERGEWRYGAQPPRNYVIEDRRRVTLNLDYEPHTQHAKIRGTYPAGRYEKEERREDRREDRRDDRREDRKDRDSY